MKFTTEMTRTGNVVSVGSINAPASGMRRFKLTDVIVGSDATPADATFVDQVQRITTTGTGTSLTPDVKDPADAAVVTVVRHIMTIEPTYAGNAMISIPRNQRTTARWNAKDGEEIIVAATANAGLGFKQSAASAVTARHNAHCDEL